MPSIEFQKLTIRDFRSFVGKHTFDIASIGVGTHFIKGVNNCIDPPDANGAGKSTIFAALSWVLFGKTSESLKSPDIRSWLPETRGPIVTLVFLLDGKKRILERHHSPNKLLYRKKPISQIDLENRIGLSFEVFHHTILFGQHRELFFDIEPRRKMEVFSEILQLERFEQWSKAASENYATYNKRVEGLKIEINTLKEQRAELKELRDQAKTQAEEWQSKLEQQQIALSKEIEKLQNEANKLQRIADDADLLLDSSLTELRPLEKQIELVRNNVSELESRYQAKLQTRRIRKRELSAEIDQMTRRGVDVCPTCGQRFENAKSRKNHLDNLRRQVEKYSREIAEPEDLRQTKQTLTTLQDAACKYRTAVDAAQHKVNYYRPEVSTIRSRIATLNQQSRERQNDDNPHLATVQSLSERIIDLRSRILDAQENHDKLEKRAIRTKFWIKGFRDIRLYVIDEVLAELEMTTNSRLAEMGLGDWQIHYNIEKETKKGTVMKGLDVIVLSPNNEKAVKWECWSGGERQRLRLVGALALSEVLLNHAGLSTNLQILDEPSNHLSRRGVQDLANLLHDWAESTQRIVFFVDHFAIESSAFASQIVVEKDQGGSKITL